MERCGCTFADSDLCNDIAVSIQQKSKITFVPFGINGCIRERQISFHTKKRQFSPEDCRFFQYFTILVFTCTKRQALNYLPDQTP